MGDTKKAPLNPLTIKPKYGSRYWVHWFTSPNLAMEVTWMSDRNDKFWFAHGLCFATIEEAQECSRRMLAAVKQDIAP